MVEPDRPCAMMIMPIGAPCATAAADWVDGVVCNFWPATPGNITLSNNAVVKSDEERLRLSLTLRPLFLLCLFMFYLSHD